MSLEFLEKKEQVRVRCDADGCKKVRSRWMPPSWGVVIVYVPSAGPYSKSLTMHVFSTKCARKLFLKLSEDVMNFKKASMKNAKVKVKPKLKKAVY